MSFDHSAISARSGSSKQRSSSGCRRVGSRSSCILKRHRRAPRSPLATSNGPRWNVACACSRGRSGFRSSRRGAMSSLGSRSRPVNSCGLVRATMLRSIITSSPAHSSSTAPTSPISGSSRTTVPRSAYAKTTFAAWTSHTVYAGAVDTSMLAASAAGVTGVPAFGWAGSHAVSGMMEPQRIVAILQGAAR